MKYTLFNTINNRRKEKDGWCVTLKEIKPLTEYQPSVYQGREEVITLKCQLSTCIGWFWSGIWRGMRRILNWHDASWRGIWVRRTMKTDGSRFASLLSVRMKRHGMSQKFRTYCVMRFVDTPFMGFPSPRSGNEVHAPDKHSHERDDEQCTCKRF